MFRTVVFFVGLIMVPMVTYSGEHVRSEVVIKSFLAMAAARPTHTASQNYVRIYVQSGAWGSSNCSPTAADLVKSDEHLLSVLLSSVAQGKKITIAVNDALKPIDDVCQVTYIQGFVN